MNQRQSSLAEVGRETYTCVSSSANAKPQRLNKSLKVINPTSTKATGTQLCLPRGTAVTKAAERFGWQELHRNGVA
jgi:hypothetical protein